jgi:predicted NBD/HSP70 family sugar kinase
VIELKPDPRGGVKDPDRVQDMNESLSALTVPSMTAPRDNPARQPSLREHNLALTLARVADSGPTSRARLAAMTGLTKATVSSLVDTLIAGGLVSELGPSAPPTVGRPGSRVGLAASGPVGIGLEINVDYLSTLTVDLSGAVRERELISADLRAAMPGTVLARAAMAARRAIERAEIAGAEVAGIAVAVPGLVETGSNVLRLAPNLGWREIPVIDELRERAEQALPDTLTMTLDNEANMAALAELWCAGHAARDGSPLRTFVHVSGEIGVGAGIVMDGVLFRGRHGYSGEIGHLPIAPPDGMTPGQNAGSPCSCGSRGCLEQFVGQEAIVQAVSGGQAGWPDNSARSGRSGRRVRRPSAISSTPHDPVTSIEESARRGEPDAVRALEQAGIALGTGIAAVLNIVDSDAVVLGGLYARLAPWLCPAIESELSRRALISSWSPIQVLVSPLAGEAAVLGAATSVVRSVITDPATYLARLG